MGVSPDIIVTRSDEPIGQDIKDKISLFCNVKSDCVIENETLSELYEAPVMLQKNGLDSIVCRELGLKTRESDMRDWQAMLERVKSADKALKIGIVGKYVRFHDAYLSIAEALRHAGYELGAKTELAWVDSETLTEQNAPERLAGLGGILVPGGFGERGVEGMIAASKYARERGVPYFGICLGMQVAVIEFARGVLGYADADSGEFDERSLHRVIDYMPGQGDEVDKGGTMRLGAYPCAVRDGSRLARAYGCSLVSERHRHRYEFVNEYRSEFERAGMLACGEAPDGAIVEAVELKEHPFYLGCQFHPEFKSRPNRAHPLFKAFAAAALEVQKAVE